LMACEVWHHGHIFYPLIQHYALERKHDSHGPWTFPALPGRMLLETAKVVVHRRGRASRRRRQTLAAVSKGTTND
jgi:hypothetical protein